MKPNRLDVCIIDLVINSLDMLNGLRIHSIYNSYNIGDNIFPVGIPLFLSIEIIYNQNMLR